MFWLRNEKNNFQLHSTDVLKIDENRCKQKYELNKVTGDLTSIYQKLPLTAVIHLLLFTYFNEK